MTEQFETENELFNTRLAAYLVLVGGPRGPQDSPTNPRSHWRLQALFNDFGRDRVNAALDQFFEENPTW